MNNNEPIRNDIPAVKPGTVRLLGRAGVTCAVVEPAVGDAPPKTSDVMEIDDERPIPYIRLRDGRLVSAATLTADERSAVKVRGRKDESSPFDRPGPTPGVSRLAAGTEVTVVVRWATEALGARALVRWTLNDGTQAFGVFNWGHLVER